MRFQFNENTSAPSYSQKSALFHVFTELATNDLKYGIASGTSTYRVRETAEGKLIIFLATRSIYDFARLGTGNGTQILKGRLEEMSGSLRMKSSMQDNGFCVRIQVQAAAANV